MLSPHCFAISTTRNSSDAPRALDQTIATPEETPAVNPQEMVKVQNYLRKVFGAKTLSVRARPKIKDSAEVYVGDEFVGTLTRDDDDGELCYQFQMAILELDLDEA